MSETPEQAAARLAEEELSRQRLEAAQGKLPTAPPSAQGERKISPITRAAMAGKPIEITVGAVKLMAKGLTVRKKAEYVELVKQWPNLLYLAVALLDAPKENGLDLEALADYRTMWDLEAYKQAEQERAERCAALAALITPVSTKEEREASEFHPYPMPEPFTEESVLEWINHCEVVEFPEKDIFVFDAIWLFVQGSPGIGWPKTYHDISEGEADNIQTVGTVEDAPPKDCVWLDDYLSEHFQLADYVDLLRALNAIAGRYAGDLVERFCRIA